MPAGFLQQSTKRYRATVTFSVLAAFSLGYAAAWFLFNLSRMSPYMPPYILGASTDATFAPPKAVTGLAVVTAELVFARQRTRLRSGVSPPRAFGIRPPTSHGS